MRHTKKGSRLAVVHFVFSTVLVLLGAPISDARGESGYVVDISTNKPLAGAYVWAMWKGVGAAVVESRTVCYRFAISKTDENGVYMLPDYSENDFPHLTGKWRQIDVYLSGYELAPRDGSLASPIKLRKAVSSAESRLKNMRSTMYSSCVTEEQEKLLVPLYKAQYEEARTIAKTTEERTLAERYRARMVDTEFGEGAYARMLMDEGRKK